MVRAMRVLFLAFPSGETLRVDSYDIIDPEAVAYVEIDGERFDMNR